MPKQNPDAQPAGRQGGWLTTIGLGLALAVIYLANGREIGTYDTEATNILTSTLLQGEGVHLDRFAPLIHDGPNRLADYAARKHGHIVSRYPVGPALLALPIVAVQSAFLDRFRPDWDANLLREWSYIRLMSSNAAAVITAILGMVLYRLLRRLVPARAAFWATLAAMIGSELWVVASQALWQHGPAALALTVAILLLVDPASSRWRFVLAGLATGLLVAFRSIDLVFAVMIAAWVTWHHTSKLPLFLIFPILVGTALLSYNLYYFGNPIGGQAELEAMHPRLHGIDGRWSSNPLEGAAGTLFSPSRGLFIFTPWVALAMVVAPWSLRGLRGVPLVPWVLWGLLPYFLMLSWYSVWWAGFCFGPRYWTDAMPLFALILAFGLAWAGKRSRGLCFAFAITIAWSVALQALGAFYYPSSWNLLDAQGRPANVDLHHDRLWDWSDTEVSRCLWEKVLKRSPLSHPP